MLGTLGLVISIRGVLCAIWLPNTFLKWGLLVVSIAAVVGSFFLSAVIEHRHNRKDCYRTSTSSTFYSFLGLNLLVGFAFTFLYENVLHVPRVDEGFAELFGLLGKDGICNILFGCALGDRYQFLLLGVANFFLALINRLADRDYIDTKKDKRDSSSDELSNKEYALWSVAVLAPIVLFYVLSGSFEGLGIRFFDTGCSLFGKNTFSAMSSEFTREMKSFFGKLIFAISFSAGVLLVGSTYVRCFKERRSLAWLLIVLLPVAILIIIIFTYQLYTAVAYLTVFCLLSWILPSLCELFGNLVQSFPDAYKPMHDFSSRNGIKPNDAFMDNFRYADDEFFRANEDELVHQQKKYGPMYNFCKRNGIDPSDPFISRYSTEDENFFNVNEYRLVQQWHENSRNSND